MANENEELSDLEYARVNTCLDGILEHKKTVVEDRLRLEEELRHLNLEDVRKLFQRQNGTIRYKAFFPEFYRERWLSVDLDVMYEQFSEFIENAMESSNKKLIVADSKPLTSLVCDGKNDPALVLRQLESSENDRGINDAQQTGGRIIEEVMITGGSGTIRTVSGASSSTSPQSRFRIDWAKWFPPVTSRTFLSHYLPAFGTVSHTLHTIHLFSPNIISGLFPTGGFAVSNMILFNANVGLGFYVYFRSYLHRVNPWERIEFSILTLTLFNFVSSRAAVLIKSLFPSKTQTWPKTLFATSLSVYLLSRGYRYMGLFDAKNSRSSVSTDTKCGLSNNSSF